MSEWVVTADQILHSTVKQLIIGEDLFGKINELIYFAKISSRPNEKKYGPHPLSSNDIPNLIFAKLWYFQNCQI